METHGEKYFKVLREKKSHQPRILYPARLAFKNEREIKTFLRKQISRKLLLLDVPYKKC